MRQIRNIRNREDNDSDIYGQQQPRRSLILSKQQNEIAELSKQTTPTVPQSRGPFHPIPASRLGFFFHIHTRKAKIPFTNPDLPTEWTSLLFPAFFLHSQATLEPRGAKTPIHPSHDAVGCGEYVAQRGVCAV